MRKIAVCGKGGSGKSVITGLLAGGLIERGRPVLVVDSDESNTGLYRMLGFDTAPAPLLDFMGGKKRVEEDLTAQIKSGIPELRVQLFKRKLLAADIPDPFVRRKDGLRLVVIGKILMALEGCSCPMGIVSRSFLTQILLGPNEIALVDMEAGVEHFGRGVETGIDGVLIVVDPSRDSLEIAERIQLLSSQLTIGDVWAVLNKIPSEELIARLTADLNRRKVTVLAAIRHDPEIFASTLEGAPLAARSVKPEIDRILDSLFP